MSDDNIHYTSVGVSEDGETFSYTDFETFEKKYIIVTETTYYGETVWAIPIVAFRTEDGYDVQYLDSDEDGIPNIFEELIGTDPMCADTDGDGLTDDQELSVTDTDPLVFASVQSGVSDANADSDGDGLSNADEILYGTDPLKADTDGDTLIDGDELKLRLDPAVPRTFGVLDSEYKVEQKIEADSAALSEINTDASPYKLSIDINAAGYVEGALEVHETSYIKAIQNDAMLGAAPELIYMGDVDTVTLRFEISEEYLDNTLNLYPKEEELAGIKRLNVFKYFEDINMLLPIETKFDLENNILYTEVDELGTYCVMNLELWLNSFVADEEQQSEAVPALMSLDAEPEAASTCFASVSLKPFLQQQPLDVVFILQTAGSSENYYKREKQMIENVSDRLFETYSDVRICIIEYKENGAAFVASDTASVWQTEADALSNALETLSYDVTTEYCNRGAAFSLMLDSVSFRDNAGKFVFQIMNGNTTVESGYFSQLDACVKRDINYSEISPSGWHYEDAAYGAKVESAIEATNGVNLTFSSGTEDDVYEHITEYLVPPQFTYVVKLATNYQEIHLKGILSPDNNVNSDQDSLMDWEEVDTTKISWNAEGEILVPTLAECMDYVQKPYAANGLSRIKDKLTVDAITMSEFEKRMYNALNNIGVLPILSNPCDEDTDGDGLWDDVDANPMHVFDQKFIHTEEKEDILTNDNIDEAMAAANASYNTMPLLEKIVSHDNLNFIYMRALATVAGGMLASMPNAAKFLTHFLNNTGQDYIYDATPVFCDIVESRKNICDNINSVLELCEDTVVEELNFITNPSVKFPGAPLSNKGFFGERLAITDWWFSIGNTDVVMSVHCERQGDTYIADIDYHFVDVYDWEQSSRAVGGLVTDGEMYELHRAGMAREYKSVGNYSFTIMWTKGERLDEENLSVDDHEIHFCY